MDTTRTTEAGPPWDRWPFRPSGQVDELPVLSLGDVVEGDLLFTARVTPYQYLCEAAGDPWRHVGMVVEKKKVLSLAEVVGDQFCSRPIEALTEGQAAIGLVRLRDEPDDIMTNAIDWTRSKLDSGHLYAWDDVIVAGIILATRKYWRPIDIDAVARAVHHAADRAASAERSTLSMTCSSFVYEAYRQAGDPSRLDVPITALWSIPNRYRSSETNAEPVSLDMLLQLDAADRHAIVSAWSLYELSAIASFDDDQERGNHGTRMSGRQLAATVRTLVHVIAGFAVGDVVPERLPLDPRWITPGDLWRLTGVATRAIIRVDD